MEAYWALLHKNHRYGAAVHYRAALRNWNEAGATFDGWPSTRFEVPTANHSYALDWAVFNASLREDLDAYVAARLDPDAVLDWSMRPIRPQTAYTIRLDVRQFASALVKQGIPVESLNTLADLIRPERVRLGVLFMLTLTNGQPAVQICSAVASLSAIARYWVKVDRQLLKDLRAIRRRTTPPRAGIGEKSRERLRLLLDPAHCQALLEFPVKVIREIEKRQTITRRVAHHAQLALAAELFLTCPMRPSRLWMLRTDLHIHREAHADGARILLEAPGDRSRRGVPIRYELSPETAEMLERHLVLYRPVLALGDNPLLFLGSQAGTPNLRNRFSSQLSRLIRTHLGFDVPPTLFRHFCAALHLKDNPGDMELVSRLLAHRWLHTTEATYGDFRTAAQVARYHAVALKSGKESPSAKELGDARTNRMDQS
jgi:integrase